MSHCELPFDLFDLGTYDFLAMNHYTSRLCTSGLDPKAKARYRDANFVDYIDESWPSSNAVWLKVSAADYVVRLRVSS